MSLSTDYSRSSNPPDFTQLNLPQLDVNAREVLEFWFDEDNKQYWFIQDSNFDKLIADKFGKLWQQAKQGECAPWRYVEEHRYLNNSNAELAGRLAEIIVLDQFSRNLCRNQAAAFAQDAMALVLAQEAIRQFHFNKLPWQWRQFMIMPFMHSESLVIHQRYLPLFEELNNANTLSFEHRHQEIIQRFGRYPHRNEALNRSSTVEERKFLQQPNSSF